MTASRGRRCRARADGHIRAQRRTRATVSHILGSFTTTSRGATAVCGRLSNIGSASPRARVQHSRELFIR
jgi:hypothetical protein